MMAVSKQASRFIWTGVILLAVIGVAAVARRTLVLLWRYFPQIPHLRRFSMPASHDI
jgi:hypothetical protein